MTNRNLLNLCSPADVLRPIIWFCLVTAGLPPIASALLAAEPVDIGSRRELFVDRHLIDRLDNARLIVQRPQPQEVSLTLDRPWETEGPGYVTVFQDGDLYRMYYRALPEGEGPRAERQVTCYAESRDGISWERPDLGIVEFQGSKENNIILRGVTSHNMTPWRDGSPRSSTEDRYKAVAGVFRIGLTLFQSPDGIQWSKTGPERLPLDGAFDSQNVVFWDGHRMQYRAYWRDFRRGDSDIPDGRDIRVAVSEDLLNWSPGGWLEYDPGRRGTTDTDGDPHQLYTNGIQPYHRAPHLLLGFPMRYIDRGWTASSEALPNLERRRELAAANIGGGRPTRLGTAITDVLFMASRDGRRFHVFPDAIIRPGIQRDGAWFYAGANKALGLVETESAIAGAPREISVYVSENSRQESPMRLRRHAFRMDGFVSVHASLDGGELLSKPIVFSGRHLELNFSTSAGGSIRVELQDEAGTPIDGFHFDDCDLLYGDQVDRVVSWKAVEDLSGLASQPVRLRFKLKDADLYSLQFVTSPRTAR